MEKSGGRTVAFIDEGEVAKTYCAAGLCQENGA